MTLEALADEFWEWRRATAPDTHDDLARVQRPPGWLPDWSPDAVTARLTALRSFADRFHRTDITHAPVNGRLVGSALARVHWELNLVRGWQRNPCFYLDQSLGPIFVALLEPVVPVQRVAELLAHVPHVLAQGEENLAGHAAAPFARSALVLLADAGDTVKSAMAALSLNAEAAVAALDSFRSWLTTGLPGFTAPTAPGAEAFRFFAHRVALLPHPVDELLAIGRREHTRAVAEEQVLRAAGRPAPRLLPTVAAQIARQHEDEQAVREFCRERGILDLPDDLRRYRNAATPAHLEPLTWLGVEHHTSTPSSPDEDAVRYLPAPRPDLPYFARAEAADPRVGIAHEGAHAWQLALSWRHPDPVRRHYYDSAPNEGIAFHHEEILLRAGLFADAPHSELFLVNAMRLRALRVEVDIGLALGSMTIEQAADRLASAVPVDRGTAWEEAVYFAGNPGQGMSYQIGKTQIQNLLAACAAQGSFSLASFHGRLWREGNVPLALQRWELLGDRDEVDEAARLGGGAGP
ncbi:DUF885 family protein [Lentzea cavernae]|uniref:DUF885 family protein n=1 Tax=Lentzea cavernae TaxID=2020703 RepID=UPI00174C160F|nr:DUF885 family protein [Lentzea cavernae]